MIYSDKVFPKGSLNIILVDGLTNKIKMNTIVPNLVVTTGKNIIASRLADDSSGTGAGKPSHMAIGTSDASLSLSLIHI